MTSSTISYPAALPAPASATIESEERRLVSPQDGARISGVHQRDRLATQQLSFVFSFAEASTFRLWWKETLIYGGSWFVSSWSLPQGGLGARRFMGAPKYELLAGYGWAVSAVCEVRGVGDLPTGSNIYYTSWPYALFVDEALIAELSEPQSGQLWLPPLELLNADLSAPVSGTLDTTLHSYSAPAQELNSDLTTPFSGTLDVVLHEYSAPAQELNADLSTPRSGTLLIQLVVYPDALPETVNADLSIPLSGTLA